MADNVEPHLSHVIVPARVEEVTAQKGKMWRYHNCLKIAKPDKNTFFLVFFEILKKQLWHYVALAKPDKKSIFSCLPSRDLYERWVGFAWKRECGG